MPFFILTLLFGYLIGMFQTGYFVGKYYGIDIREHGSKSAGMTNVNRTLGKFPALIVFVVDVLKAIFAFVFVPSIVYSIIWGFEIWAPVFENFETLTDVFANETIDSSIASLAAGLGTVLGHNFPFYLKFKGGKGIACTLGIILMLNWHAAFIAFGVGFILVIIFRYISLASLAITLIWPVLLVFFSFDLIIISLAAVISLLAWIMHRENIKRLFTKTEPKFSFGK